MKDKDFQITLQNFHEGNSPLAHIDDKTFIGNAGQASYMQADILTRPGFLTQGPGLADLVNGNDSGAVKELIRFIFDKPVLDNTYGVGTSSLFKLNTTTVIDDDVWPQTIANMVSGESIARLDNDLFIFYNTASGGDIATMPIASEIINTTWGSVTDLPLQNAKHPSAVKEDIIMFGNGRYAGVYIKGSSILNTKKLDFGEGAEVVDIVFSANLWWIAVNTGTGERTQSQVFMYDGSATSAILADEAGIGVQRIGFLYVLNGLVYICYEDLSSDSFIIGFFSGRQIKPLRYFTGSLPDHRQKTLYKNTILFLAGHGVWSAGAAVQQLPLQISKLSDGGYQTLGAIAAPFGTPMIASTDNAGKYRLAQFSGYALDSQWKSIFIDISSGINIGKLTAAIVITKPLAANAKAILKLEGNQAMLEESDAKNATETSVDMEISGENKTRHIFTTIGMKAVQDFRAYVSWTNGNTVNDCPIRKIILLGSRVER